MIVVILLFIWGYVGLIFYVLMTIEFDGEFVKEDMKSLYIVYSFLFGLLMILYYLEAKRQND